MRRHTRFIVIVLLAFSIAPNSYALNAQDAQRACDDLTKAAEQARKDMIQAAIPRKDPGKTFNDATKSCLANIAQFKDIFTFKSLSGAAIQQFITQMATQMMQQACQAAQQEFDKRVQDAMGQVNQQTGGYVNVSTGGINVNVPSYGGYGGTTVPVTGGSDANPTQQQPDQKEGSGFFSGLLNWARGGNGTGGKQ